MNKDTLMAMSLDEIASNIYRLWKDVYFGAAPYLSAMMSMNSVNDDYGCDSGKSIVLYFLSNARNFKGEDAKLIKAELNRRIK
jgi:hypothetical protein